MMYTLLIIGVITILLVVSIYSACRAYLMAYTLSHPKRNSTKLKDFKLQVQVEKFDFMSHDGIPLKGIDIRPDSNVKGTIIICHNLGGSKEVGLSFVEFLLEEGYRLVSFDYRNHGESGDYKGVRIKFYLDFQAFAEKIFARGIDPPLGIYGLSVGSNVAIFGMKAYPAIRALAIDSGPLIFAKGYFNYVLDFNKVKNVLTRWFFLSIFLYYSGYINLTKRTTEDISHLADKPLFFIHGQNDNIITKSNVLTAAKYAKLSEEHIFLVPKSRHLTNFFLAREEYKRRLSAFFINNL